MDLNIENNANASNPNNNGAENQESDENGKKEPDQ